MSKKAASKWVELPLQEMEGSRGLRLSEACDHIQPGADWRDLPSAAGPAERQPAGCGSGRAPSSATLPAPRLHPANLAVVVGSSRLGSRWDEVKVAGPPLP